jgi:hypothetical protein
MRKRIWARAALYAAVALLVVIAGYGLLSQSGRGQRRGSTSGNIVNGGLMGGDADFVFYRSEADGWSLYRARHDGSERQKLSDDVPAYINVLDGWVYFANYADGLRLYKIRIDGTGRTKLTDCGVKDINVVDDTIYYVNGDNPDADHIDLPYEMKVDGSGNRLIAQVRCSELVYDDGSLYFVGSAEGTFPIFRMKTSGQEITRLNDTYSYFLNVLGEHVFYWDVEGGRLRRMKTDGSENVALTETWVDYVNAYGGWVYYVNAGDAYNLYRVRVHGSGSEKLTDLPPDAPESPSFSPTSVYVIGDRVYYRAFHSELTGVALFSVALDGSGQVAWDVRALPTHRPPN